MSRVFIYEVQTIQDLGQMSTASLCDGDWARVTTLGAYAGERWTGEFMFSRTQPKAYSWYFKSENEGYWVAEERRLVSKAEANGPRGAMAASEEQVARALRLTVDSPTSFMQDQRDAIAQALAEERARGIQEGLEMAAALLWERHDFNQAERIRALKGKT